MQRSKNVKFIAYLRFNEIHPDRVEQIARGKAEYYFEMVECEWRRLKEEFNKSDFLLYAQCLDAVTDLAY